MSLSTPQPFTELHDTAGFNSGVQSLDIWLKERALKNQQQRATRTFVVTTDENSVIGYYALAAGSVSRGLTIPILRRNMPDPVPVTVLARLAIDRGFQGQGVGHGLLKDSVFKTLAAADILGIKGMLVHAIDENALRFYRYFGFKEFPAKSLTLMASLEDLKQALLDSE